MKAIQVLTTPQGKVLGVFSPGASMRTVTAYCARYRGELGKLRLTTVEVAPDSALALTPVIR